ncbi:diguanylate cyclase domain-containing protein [Geomobilimonas luticola]|uniref:Diguanylate cyclase n=1 Tax=Geomobilimonas luticola TaxID=1114878 RepID=A0ABS5SDV6_9BACT|nr:diguanylate cyclase [Geomobilimonas luticola]MBT0653560.1 diguanylate cyclase [Geomobilimonas luticola]
MPESPALSLKAKLALAVSSLLVILLTFFSLVFFGYFRTEFKKTIANQQETLAKGLADQIDDKLRAAQKTLLTMVDDFPPAIADSPDKVQQFLDTHLGAFPVFDNGIYLFSPAGQLVAESPFQPAQRGQNFSGRSFFKEALKSRNPEISDPYYSTQPHHPTVIMFTAPIIDENDTIVAILGGSLDIMSDSFLGELSRIRIARSGYLYLYDTKGTMIMHPNRLMVLRREMPAGSKKFFDASVKGFEGTGTTVTADGVRMVTSVKRLTTKNWILGATYPEAEAYAPIARARRYWLAATLIVACCAIIATWLFVRRLTIPLYQLNHHMREISQSGMKKPLHLDCNDEIAELAETFNRMIESLGEKEATVKKLSVAVEQSPSIVVITDASGVIEYVNPKFCDVTGYSRDEAVGENPRILKSGEMDPATYRQLWECIVAGGEWRGEFHNKRKDGSCYWAAATITGIRDEAGEITHFLGMQEDITARKEAETRLMNMAMLDNLTGLANRNLLQDRLTQQLAYAERHQTTIGLLFIDLDHFKQVNDTLGHAIGDLLLRSFADTLVSCVRKSDTVARLGGDEFIIMLTDITDPDTPGMIARKILDALQTPFDLEGHRLAAHASIGIAIYPMDGRDDETLLRNADLAMYNAKQASRNTYLFYTPEMRTTTVCCDGSIQPSA